MYQNEKDADVLPRAAKAHAFVIISGVWKRAGPDNLQLPSHPI